MSGCELWLSPKSLIFVSCAVWLVMFGIIGSVWPFLVWVQDYLLLVNLCMRPWLNVMYGTFVIYVIHRETKKYLSPKLQQFFLQNQCSVLGERTNLLLLLQNFLEPRSCVLLVLFSVLTSQASIQINGFKSMVLRSTHSRIKVFPTSPRNDGWVGGWLLGAHFIAYKPGIFCGLEGPRSLVFLWRILKEEQRKRRDAYDEDFESVGPNLLAGSLEKPVDDSIPPAQRSAFQVQWTSECSFTPLPKQLLNQSMA